MAPRAIWRGHLTVGDLSCAVALHAAATTSERVSFHIVNRRSGSRVRREYVDAQTGKPVERGDQVKGYEIARNSYIVLEPEEIAAALPQGDKTLAVESFIPCDEVDTTYFDKPYFLTAIAPYSTRARAGATVAMPLAWDELVPAITSDHFTVSNAMARLDNLPADPWADFRKAAAELRQPARR